VFVSRVLIPVFPVPFVFFAVSFSDSLFQMCFQLVLFSTCILIVFVFVLVKSMLFSDYELRFVSDKSSLSQGVPSLNWLNRGQIRLSVRLDSFIFICNEHFFRV